MKPPLMTVVVDDSVAQRLRQLLDAELIARDFHDTYEINAHAFGYETREASRKPWDEVPENLRSLMISVVREVVCMRIASIIATSEASKE